MTTKQEQRQLIADAVSAVAGVAGTADRPAVPALGCSWPTWKSATRYTGCSLLDTWWVWVVVAAGDEQSTAAIADTMLAPVWNALEAIAQVELVEPFTIELDGSGTQSLPVLRYTITTIGEV